MTREKAKVLLPIIQAIIDGREIQVNLNGKWVDVDENHNCVFLPESYEYRVKPMITYRPFKNDDECWNEMLRHQPFGWTLDKDYNIYDIVTRVTGSGILFAGSYFNEIATYDFSYDRVTFADGTPFGVKEEK